MKVIIIPALSTKQAHKTQSFHPQRDKKCSKYLQIFLRFFIALRIKILHFSNLFGAQYGIILFTLLTSLPAFASPSSPWGKDSGMVSKPHPIKKKHSTFLGENLIWFHKNVVSPADGPRSHHKPNSSQYTIDAMRKYGFYWGYLMGCDRLMRENEDPWIYKTIRDEKGETFKWDPVK